MGIKVLGTQGLVEYAWRHIGEIKVLYYRFLDRKNDWKPVAY